mmetsp:Transcript_49320/g.96759  ORF Transcript_49320/g.96759 Transcript_49320/m.96759 type:complete len:266 (+) Transcript_49320:58-855(+)
MRARNMLTACSPSSATSTSKPALRIYSIATIWLVRLSSHSSTGAVLDMVPGFRYGVPEALLGAAGSLDTRLFRCFTLRDRSGWRALLTALAALCRGTLTVWRLLTDSTDVSGCKLSETALLASNRSHAAEAETARLGGGKGLLLRGNNGRQAWLPNWLPTSSCPSAAGATSRFVAGSPVASEANVSSVADKLGGSACVAMELEGGVREAVASLSGGASEMRSSPPGFGPVSVDELRPVSEAMLLVLLRKPRRLRLTRRRRGVLGD